MPYRKRPSRRPFYARIAIASVIVLLAAGGVLKWYFRPEIVPLTAMQSWLRDNGYRPPPRVELAPGTVLRQENDGPSVWAATWQFISPPPSDARAADMSWNVDADVDALASNRLLSDAVVV